MFEAIAFYFFATILIASAVMVIAARNPVHSVLFLILVAELSMAGSVWALKPAAQSALAHATPPGVTNTEALGRILYTDYVYYFQIAGLVLLVAMIGAIVLTLRERVGVRRQSIPGQLARRGADSIEIKKIPSRSGV